MAIAKKGRRKIVRNGREFYWCVKPDYDFGDNYLTLSIVSEDKKFIVSYPLWSRVRIPETLMPHNLFIVNIGKEFKGLDNLGHVWERFITPNWNDNIVTPSLVANIIDWCFTVEDVVTVDYSGKVLENRLDDRKLLKPKEAHFKI